MRTFAGAWPSKATLPVIVAAVAGSTGAAGAAGVVSVVGCSPEGCPPQPKKVSANDRGASQISRDPIISLYLPLETKDRSEKELRTSAKFPLAPPSSPAKTGLTILS